jgi:uncharacterized membrane protein YhaH (DUF805 family)
MFKNPFSFKGRIKRTEFGISFIIYMVVYVLLIVVAEGRNSIPALALLFIPLVWFLWAQGAKRCHDLNRSGWWQLIPFYVFWLIFDPGDRLPNQYDLGYETYAFGADDYEKPYMADEQMDNGTPAPKDLNDGSLL